MWISSTPSFVPFTPRKARPVFSDSIRSPHSPTTWRTCSTCSAVANWSPPRRTLTSCSAVPTCCVVCSRTPRRPTRPTCPSTWQRWPRPSAGTGQPSAGVGPADPPTRSVAPAAPPAPNSPWPSATSTRQRTPQRGVHAPATAADAQPAPSRPDLDEDDDAESRRPNHPGAACRQPRRHGPGRQRRGTSQTIRRQERWPTPTFACRSNCSTT